MRFYFFSKQILFKTQKYSENYNGFELFCLSKKITLNSSNLIEIKYLISFHIM